MIDPVILILPDIHGRDFYKEAVREAVSRNIEIVCLGDYLDPYDEPYPTLRESGIWAPLSEFLELKGSRPHMTHLLLGNHDCSYLYDRSICPVRFDEECADFFHMLFTNNASQFSLFHDTTIAGRRFLISHAGVTRGWLYETGKESLDELLEWLRYGYMEFCLDPKKAMIWRYLAHRGEERGGWDKAGSIIWADFWEHVDKFNDFHDPALTQIVGHTQLNYHPVSIGTRLYCLDCREPFYIDSEGVIRSWKTDESIMHKYDILER